MSDYKRNPRGARRARKSMGRKAIVVLSLMMVLVLAAVGGTIAWLADSTTPVVNTFTVGNIDIDLAESQNLDLKMVPGHTIDKDPVVSVDEGSEDCWLFVKIDESTVLDNYIEYEIAAGWTELTTGSNIWYRIVAATDTEREFSVLKEDQVTVKGTVTKTMMDALNEMGATQPTLTFTAYAIQKDDNFTTAAAAWTQISTQENFNTTTGANE